MAKKPTFGSLSFTFGSTEAQEATPVPEETPFRMLLVGDFSGRANRGLRRERGARLKPLEVDRDNFEELLERLGVELHLPVDDDPGAPRCRIALKELDDFHPDEIYAKVELFQSLRETRERLLDPDTFQAAAREVQGWAGAGSTAEASGPAEPGETSAAADPAALLRQMLEEDEPEKEAPGPAARRELDELLRRVVAPHVVPAEDPRQDALVETVDRAIGDQMRRVLHHRDFQALEAAWRGLYLLVRRLETGARLKLYVLDLSPEELAGELTAEEDLQATALCKCLVEEAEGTLGGQPWSLIAGIFAFEETAAHAEVLGRMAKLARAAGAPFVAGASSRMVGCESFGEAPDPDDWRHSPAEEGAEAWQALRSLEDARWLGLLLPRFLARHPYGQETYGTESFEFEELGAPPAHEDYLWGNPAFAVALVLGRAFAERGWNLRQDLDGHIEGLPVHVYEEDGERVVKPCAEAALSDRAVKQIMERGLMPVVWEQDRDAIQLVRLQSLTDPPAGLAGRWTV